MADVTEKTVYEKFSFYKPLDMSALPKPNSVSDQQVLKTISDRLTTMELRLQELAKIHDQKPFFCMKKSLVFHHDPAVATSAARQLTAFGFADVVIASAISQAFALILGDRVECVFVHYDGEDDQAIDFIRELNETRNISPVYVIAVCPGEASFKKLTTGKHDLIIDEVMLPEKTKGIFQEKIKNVFESWSKNTFPSCVHQLRSVFRAVRCGVHEEPLANDVRSELLECVERTPNKKRWALAERGLQAIIMGDKAKAKLLLFNLNRQYGDLFDTTLVVATQMKNLEGSQKAASWLFSAVENHRDLNLEKAYSVGATLARWKTGDVLWDFLLLWLEREDLRVDHQFHFILAKFYDLKGDAARSAMHLRTAVAEAPLRIEYVFAFCDLLVKSGNVKSVVELLNRMVKAGGIDAAYIQKKVESLQRQPLGKAS